MSRISHGALFEGRIPVDGILDLEAAKGGNDPTRVESELHVLRENDLLDAALAAAKPAEGDETAPPASIRDRPSNSRIAELGHDVLAHADQILAGSPIGEALIELARVAATDRETPDPTAVHRDNHGSEAITLLKTAFSIQLPTSRPETAS
ncbi:hypothetical protein [Qipengyuania spongiae]|uniref:Uncharacterized protein n=1 Tax=Qipengyuania spongiae TaxID=2909673 RepID=A0ABY5SW49_9SPHN|nr:hypothetical protein [Qipengyuania spongiae]UVI38375.1 hypothetical protein L1F33_08880 [Qipengyuania spongiae]